jgi:2-hydroxy-3-oxopropionate reductase
MLRRPRAGGNPVNAAWIPAFAGMTTEVVVTRFVKRLYNRPRQPRARLICWIQPAIPGKVRAPSRAFASQPVIMNSNRTTPRIGFIGLGIMGRPMALNLRRAGYPMVVHARRPDPARPLLEAGAENAASPRFLARRADVIFTMVSDTPDVEEVIVGPEGVLHGAAAGTVVVDMSTISPAATRQIASSLGERDIAMLDAPVSGGEQGAIEGTLSIMVGGQQAVFERVLPLFECMGKHIVHVGDGGAGQVAKACNQVLVAETIAAVAEALLLARVSGVDAAQVREALLGGFAYSRVLEVHGQRMLGGNYKPGFKARLHCKDMRIALEAARHGHIHLPGAARASQYLEELVGTGEGELDSAAIARVVERLAARSKD